MEKYAEQLKDYFENASREEINEEIVTMMPWNGVEPMGKDAIKFLEEKIWEMKRNATRLSSGLGERDN